MPEQADSSNNQASTSTTFSSFSSLSTQSCLCSKASPISQQLLLTNTAIKRQLLFFRSNSTSIKTTLNPPKTQNTSGSPKWSSTESTSTTSKRTVKFPRSRRDALRNTPTDRMRVREENRIFLKREESI